MELERFVFDKDGCVQAGKNPKGINWSVVYMINGQKEMYVGETSSFQKRFKQHLDSKKNDGYETIRLVGDDDFHKSYVQDIEQRLIRLCSADGKFKIQNRNSGLSAEHNYPQKAQCEGKIREIWDLMSKENLTDHSYDELINTNIFKYSPYTSLTKEQKDVSYDVLSQILNDLKGNRPGTSVVNGSAGTGKTIVALNMIFTLKNILRMNLDQSFNPSDRWHVLIEEWKEYVSKLSMPKIAFVVPMQSIRATLAGVIKEIGDGLDEDIVIGPNDVVKNKYDIVFVDESHRLRKRKNLTNYRDFDSCCAKLGLDPKTANQLDWIMIRCKHRVLFYDASQSVKSSDVTVSEYKNSLGDDFCVNYYLKSQMRCLGGNDYINYVQSVFNLENPKRMDFIGFEVESFNNVSTMVDKIKEDERKHKLCRVVAGFSWEWKTKKNSLKEIKKQNLFDIEIGGNKYIWNTTDKNWILSENAINEIGCIHTTQGYDLNYVGIIFGEEIDYDEKNNRFIVDLSNFYDKKVKAATPPEQVKEYIINAYKVMMTRGIKGCYLYACKSGMKNFLKKWF